MTDTIPERVARGAALLDQRLPGWHEHIDLDLLDLRDGCDCILGQEFADRHRLGYLVGLEALFDWREDQAARHGFTIERCLRGSEKWDALTAEWRRVILARRAEAGEVR